MCGPSSMMYQDFHRCSLTTELTLMDTIQLNLLQMKCTNLVSSKSSCSEYTNYDSTIDLDEVSEWTEVAMTRRPFPKVMLKCNSDTSVILTR